MATTPRIDAHAPPVPARAVEAARTAPVPDGLARMLAVYGLWVAFASECVLALLLLRAPVESLAAAAFSYRNAWQLERRFQFEATYLLAVILVGGALFALAIVAEHRFRTTSAWSHVYQRPFYPELLRRFAQVAAIPAVAVGVAIVAEQLVLRLA